MPLYIRTEEKVKRGTSTWNKSAFIIKEGGLPYTVAFFSGGIHLSDVSEQKTKAMIFTWGASDTVDTYTKRWKG